MADERKGKLFKYGPEQIQKDAGSLSLLTPLGTRHSDAHLVFNQSEAGAATALSTKAPGIIVEKFMLTPGLSEDGSSDINLAARKLWSFIRQKNSGARNYDTPDLTMYVLSVTSAWGAVFEMVRAYGILQQYSSKNRYMGRSLLLALGFDPVSLETDLADFRAYINLTIEKLNALKIPGDWDILNRLMLLCTNVFKDGEVDKSQLFGFRLEQIWKWNSTGTYVGSLTPVRLVGTGGGAMTLANIKTIIDSVINEIVADEDTNTMSGDIEKAYDSGTFTMQLIPETWRTEPTYSRDALLILLNSSVYPIGAAYSANTGNIIWQDATNAIIFKPLLATVGSSMAGEDKGDNVTMICGFEYLDFATIKDVGPYEVLVASEMTTLIKHDLNAADKFSFVTFGVLLPVSATAFALQPDSGNMTQYPILRFVAQDSDLALSILPRAIGTLTKFDWHPRETVWFTTNNGDSGHNFNANLIADVFDLGNYTTIEAADLKKLHTAHVISAMDLTE